MAALALAGFLLFILVNPGTVKGFSGAEVECEALLTGPSNASRAQVTESDVTDPAELQELERESEGICDRREHQHVLYAIVAMPLIYFLGRRGLPGDGR